jgi:hypothetical protein
MMVGMGMGMEMGRGMRDRVGERRVADELSMGRVPGSSEETRGIHHLRLWLLGMIANRMAHRRSIRRRVRTQTQHGIVGRL